ncbi:hypothetical protein MAR_031103 [Mya arenaria]|uniref:Uncharacterized protein n=1 Tax=Mya arenaria TaxID=6604 RepID=A0ABY7F5R1_MYAAR|nr:hypothetical protein MAR_031103 [Mya arenaria]
MCSGHSLSTDIARDGMAAIPSITDVAWECMAFIRDLVNIALSLYAGLLRTQFLMTTAAKLANSCLVIVPSTEIETAPKYDNP